VDLIGALKLTTPDILGSSLGSLISQAIAVNYASAVSHIILSDTALLGSGLLTIPDPVNASNVFVQANGMGSSVISRTYSYYLPAGLAGLCRNKNLTSNMPVDVPTSQQLTHQATIGNDIAGPGGNEVSNQPYTLLKANSIWILVNYLRTFLVWLYHSASVAANNRHPEELQITATLKNCSI
jgi:pimeloyl-ACP methyl ester carboxylesterase